MLELMLIRDRFTDVATTGRLLYDGKPFGYVCEDVDRGLDAAMSRAKIAEMKIPGRTAIPTGRYEIGWVHSPSRGKFTPRLLDVPGFRGILIHSGNTAIHTEGCLLPGMGRKTDRVDRSSTACSWLYARIRAACETGEVWITIERDAAAWAARSG